MSTPKNLGYVRRSGKPVPYIHRRRHWAGWRRLKTTAERRLNALVLKEEGEVPARRARMNRNLPDSWDDYTRSDCGCKCWKIQRKGVKAWDR